MKARAKCWLKHDGRWVAPGEVFDANTPEALSGLAEILESETSENSQDAASRPEWVGPSAELMPGTEPEKPKATAKRGRKKKTEE